MILVFLLHAILAAIFPIGRVATEIAAPIFFTAVRMGLGGGALLFFSWMRYGNSIARLWQVIWVVLAFAITGIYLTNAFEFWALQYLPSAKASFIYSLSPFAAALLSYIFFQEKMTIKKCMGMGIGLIGFSIMIIHHAPGETSECSFGFISAAEGALIVAAITSAAGWILLRKNIRRHKTAIFVEILGSSMLVGSLFCFIHSYLLESWNPIPVFDYPNTLGLFAIYMVLALLSSNLIGYPLYTELLKTYTATFLSFAGFIEPLCAALYGWIFLGEVVTLYFFAASVLVFIGLYVFYIEELRQGYIVKKIR